MATKRTPKKVEFEPEFEPEVIEPEVVAAVVKARKLPEGVVLNTVKGTYQAVVNNKRSLNFETAAEAAQVYKLAVKYPQFFQLNFPDYLF
jgi:hypothetical protein